MYIWAEFYSRCKAEGICISSQDWMKDHLLIRQMCNPSLYFLPHSIKMYFAFSWFLVSSLYCDNPASSTAFLPAWSLLFTMTLAVLLLHIRWSTFFQNVLVRLFFFLHLINIKCNVALNIIANKMKMRRHYSARNLNPCSYPDSTKEFEFHSH